MQQQGLSRADALAALLLEEGSAEEALVRAVTCQELGGAAKVWADMQPARDDVDDALQAAEVRGGCWNERCGFDVRVHVVVEAECVRVFAAGARYGTVCLASYGRNSTTACLAGNLKLPQY